MLSYYFELAYLGEKFLTIHLVITFLLKFNQYSLMSYDNGKTIRLLLSPI